MSSSNEPAQKGDAYAFDGQEESPMSPGMQQLKREEGEEFISACDRVTNVIAVAMLFIILIMSILSIAAGACCLSSVSGKPFKHFSFFMGFGVTPVVIGVLCFILSLFVILFIALCAMGLGRYGMCCYGASCCRATLRVLLLGVFPFIVIIILLAMIIVGFTFFSLSQQLAPLNKSYTKISGITGAIDIVRDENGLTHIKASNRRDAIFAQGFAVAQDRLFQLEFHRLTAKGQLSYLAGKDARQTDIMMRTLNVKKAGAALCNNTAPEHLELLEAFAEGANLFMKKVSKRPVEFFFIGRKALYFHDPEPFHAIDICLTGRLFQFQMSSNMAAEGERFKIWAGTQRTYEDVMSLYPDFTSQPNTIMTAAQTSTLVTDEAISPNPSIVLPFATARAYEGSVYDQILKYVRAMVFPTASASSTGPVLNAGESFQSRIGKDVANLYKDTLHSPISLRDDPVFANKFIHASNAWAARDSSNHAMAASDPHLTVNLPSVWYWVHLSFPTEDGVPYDCAGVSLIGIPGVHIGHTTHIAWGITMSKTDLEDLFIFAPSSFSGLAEGQYAYQGEVRTFVRRTERVETKGMKDVIVEARDTLMGPIVSSMLGFPSLLQVALYAVPLRTDDDSSIAALLGMSDPNTNTAEKMMNNLLMLQSPGFSIPIADASGNIAYAVTGSHPMRVGVHTGLFPTCAFDAAGILSKLAGLGGIPAGASFTDMLPLIREFMDVRSTYATYVSATGGADTRIPKEHNPHVHIPADGTEAHISAANQMVVPMSSYPYFLGADYSWPYRGRRIQELLDAATGTYSDIETHKKIQLDGQSNIWAYEFRDIVAGATFQAGIASDASAKQWSDRMLAWDMTTPIGSVETAFMWSWFEMMTVLPRDAVKASGDDNWSITNRYLYTSLTAPTTAMTDECVSYMSSALGVSGTSCMDFAVATFKKLANSGFDKQWGKDLNRMSTLHEMLSKKIIHPIWRREIEKSGDMTTVCVSDHAETGKMQSTQASSMRQLYDLWNDKGHMLFAFPGGNSGNPYSKYYDNLLASYSRNEYVTAVTAYDTWDTMTVGESQSLSP